MRATKVNAGLAESNGRLLLGLWRDSLHVTCGLTACTSGSAPGPTLGNEYGKTLPLPLPGEGVQAEGRSYNVRITTDGYRFDMPMNLKNRQQESRTQFKLGTGN